MAESFSREKLRHAPRTRHGVELYPCTALPALPEKKKKTVTAWAGVVCQNGVNEDSRIFDERSTSTQYTTQALDYTKNSVPTALCLLLVIVCKP